MRPDLPRAFADVTARLEDAHSLAVEGQRRDNASDMQRVLVGQLRAGLAEIDGRLSAMAAMLDRSSR
ncbi:hypothetical protein [Novosphingobium pokkalii]|uniref:Uncharacterized protein n=1 Tax=Novosphingobium pokkalii TaxID=1770194 RepID=A0ABV7V7W8_9SPHN|nr:hypothetical protein [Novosphingobium pokkalii]GHD02162.1 hypothetical protein GCM10019060_37290 [Novosphingobium pokkalii]